VNDPIERIKEELKRLVKNGMPTAEFRAMVDLLEEGGLIRTRLRILQDVIFAFYRQRAEMSGGDAKRRAE
jgi:hypothetical protein